jgi:5-methylcytosine-specific restriction endonuclease McrA
MAYTKEQRREHYLAHRDRALEMSRARYKANKLTVRERQKEWRAENQERVKKYKREMYLINRDTFVERSRAWRSANQERELTGSRNRKARAKGSEGFHTGEDVKAIWVRQGMKCAVPGCTYPISDKIGSKHKFHIDHVRPYARGGSNWPSNLQILCRFHNMQKLNKDEKEWALAHGISLETKGKL